MGICSLFMCCRAEEKEALLKYSSYEDESEEEEEEDYLLDLNGPSVIPFSKIHEQCLAFDDPKQNMLIPGCEIHVKIVDAIFDPSSLLNPYLYVINLEHGWYKWTIRCRFKDFLHLHNRLLLCHATLAIPFPTHKHKERRKSFGMKQVPQLPHFPQKPEILITQDDISERKKSLEQYLQKVVRLHGFRTFHETILCAMADIMVERTPSVLSCIPENIPRVVMAFLGISPLSFIDGLGHKGVEGFVQKWSGGYVFTTFVKVVNVLFSDCCGNWTTRWIVVKDNFVASVRPSDGIVHCVLLMDHAFKVELGANRNGKSEALLISNLSRNLHLKCRSNREAIEWKQELKKAIERGGFEFIKPNRFNSFAPPRPLTCCRWITDGATYFEAVAVALDKAKEEIFISDWWLTPEIYLRRPIYHGHYWQLDYVLKRKAVEGVKIFILLYKEVEVALGINSSYSKRKLKRLHKNIKVLRHPGVSRGVLLWAHHEKIVCIDQTYAFIGGLDLCYGRWDDYQHRLTDLGEVEEELMVKRAFSVTSETSKPKLRSATSLDIFQSESKKQVLKKVASDCSLEKLKTFSQRAVLNVPITESTKISSLNYNSGETEKRKFLQHAVKKVQAVKRLQLMKTQLVAGTLCEGKDASDINFLNLSTPADVHRTIQKIAVVHLGLERKFRLWHGKDYTNFICKDLVSLDSPYLDLVDRNKTPRMPWHDIGMFVQGAAARDVARYFIQRWNFAKLEKAKRNDFYPYLLPKSYEDVDNVPPILTSEVGTMLIANCQVLRSASIWSAGITTTEQSILTAYIDSISKAQHFIYVENQFFVSQAFGHRDVYNGIAEALYQRIIKAHREGKPFHVYVVMPLLPAFEGEIGTSTGRVILAVTHWNYTSICRGSNSLIQRLAKKISDPSHYISFYGLRKYGVLNNTLVTELIYVHSKLMIVDDNVAIIGSANINDRSLLGRRDSEIAIIINDTIFFNSVMNGQPYEAGRFCGSLRTALFREHLGLLDSNPNNIDVRDPVSEAFFRDVWLKTATRNTAIYEKVFHCIPTDEARSFSQLKSYQAKPPLAVTDKMTAKQNLKDICGYLVLLPHYFLCEENLSPALATKESFLPSSVWT